MSRLHAILRLPAQLRRDTGGVALIEFALLLPIFIVMCLTGAELTHYIATKMRISQLALQLSDDAARIGSGTRLSAKKITERDINDLFIGAQLQSGELDLKRNGRVVLSSLEPMANPNTTNRYKITWQRCFGDKTYAPVYGTAGQTGMTGMGPATRQAYVQDDNATMFVEVFYDYQPLVEMGTRAPTGTLMEIASMAVRERRDLTDDTTLPNGTTNPNPQHPKGVYKVSGVTPATC